MESPLRIAQQLCERAQRPQSIAEFRAHALALVRTLVPFDVALFHELSPRVPLDRAAVVGVDPGALAHSRGSWDELAVVLGRLRDLALARGGVATARDAFGPRSAGRKAWNERVAPLLGTRETLMAHLVVEGRIVAAIMLGRRRPHPFDEREQDTLRALVPTLSVTDALRQTIEDAALRGLAAELRCEDQRLTERQRELVVLVALGNTDADIAQALGISANTVRNHLVQIRERLGAANRAEIVRLAVLR